MGNNNNFEKKKVKKEKNIKNPDSFEYYEEMMDEYMDEECRDAKKKLKRSERWI